MLRQIHRRPLRRHDFRAVVVTLACALVTACSGSVGTDRLPDATEASVEPFDASEIFRSDVALGEDDAASDLDVGGADAAASPDAAAPTDAGHNDAARADAARTDAARTDASGPIGPTQTATASYYDAQARIGNCSFGALPQSAQVAAVSDEVYANARACGMCVRVTGAAGTAVLPVVDRCPGCASTRINLSEPAFQAVVGRLAIGVGSVRWAPVPCPVSGPLKYVFRTGSTSTALYVQIRNHRLPVRSLEMRVGSSWVALDREPYNYFFRARAGSGPYGFRVTATTGEQVLDNSVPLRPGGTVESSSQF